MAKKNHWLSWHSRFNPWRSGESMIVFGNLRKAGVCTWQSYAGAGILEFPQLALLMYAISIWQIIFSFFLRPAGGDPEIDRQQKHFFDCLCFFEWTWPFWTPLKAFREEAVWFKQRKTRRKVAPFLTPLGAARAARSADWLKIDMWENPSFQSS